MSLYVEVRRSEDGVVVTNATFPGLYFNNYGNGQYYVWCNPGAWITISAPGRNSLLANTDSYYYLYAYLTRYVHSDHSSGHSSGWT